MEDARILVETRDSRRSRVRLRQMPFLWRVADEEKIRDRQATCRAGVSATGGPRQSKRPTGLHVLDVALAKRCHAKAPWVLDWSFRITISKFPEEPRASKGRRRWLGVSGGFSPWRSMRQRLMRASRRAAYPG